jgi:hypothetical protein
MSPLLDPLERGLDHRRIVLTVDDCEISDGSPPGAPTERAIRDVWPGEL